MQLQLERIVAVARRVEHHPGRLVDLHQRDGFERGVGGQRGNQLAAEIVEIEVAPAVALGLPDEAAVVLQEHRGRAVLDPAGRPLFAQHHPHFPARRLGGHHLEDVLAAVGAVEQQFPAVGAPVHVIGVVADDVVGERLAVAHVDLCRLLRGDVVDQEIDDRVRRAGLRVGLGVHGALQLGLIELQVVVGNAALVEAIERHLAAVGRPPDGGDLIELFAVDPARGAVLDALVGAAVAGDGGLGLGGEIHQIDVAVLVVVLGPQRAVRRIGGGVLASALRRALSAPAPAAAGRRRRPRRAASPAAPRRRSGSACRRRCTRSSCHRRPRPGSRRPTSPRRQSAARSSGIARNRPSTGDGPAQRYRFAAGRRTEQAPITTRRTTRMDKEDSFEQVCLRSLANPLVRGPLGAWDRRAARSQP